MDGDGNEMNNEATYAMPAAMAFYSNSSDDISQSLLLASPSVTVTCTHNFELNNIKVDWSVEYPSDRYYNRYARKRRKHARNRAMLRAIRYANYA